MKLLVATSLFVLGTSSAFAVDLVNKDGQQYEIKVRSSASTMTASIQGGTTKQGICSECEIEIVGVGTVKATGSDKVVIKDGRLAKE